MAGQTFWEIRCGSTGHWGFYDSFEIAFKDAVRALGLREDFLVKQVFAVEPVYFIYQLFA